jgi:hypothetical protein
MGAAVVVVWYGVLLTSHLLIGRPKRNPFTSPSQNYAALLGPEVERLPVDITASSAHGLVALGIVNRANTETFLAEVMAAAPSPLATTGPPAVLRWKGFTSEKQEIVRGQKRELEIVKVAHVKAQEHQPCGRFALGEITLQCVTGEMALAVQTPNPIGVSTLVSGVVPFHVIRPIRLTIRLSAVGRNAGETIEVVIGVGTDGYAPPFVDAFVIRHV